MCPIVLGEVRTSFRKGQFDCFPSCAATWRLVGFMVGWLVGWGFVYMGFFMLLLFFSPHFLYVQAFPGHQGGCNSHLRARACVAAPIQLLGCNVFCQSLGLILHAASMGNHKAQKTSPCKETGSFTICGTLLVAMIFHKSLFINFGKKDFIFPKDLSKAFSYDGVQKNLL